VKWGPLVVGDIGDRALVRKTVKRFGIRATVHFAAHAHVGKSVEQPRKYFDNNVSKTLALLELLDASVDKFVFSSSCATYGIPRVLPIAEHHRQLPINPYGASKLFLENVLYWYERAYGDPPALIATHNLADPCWDGYPEIRFVDNRADGLAVAPENAPQATAAGRTRE